MMIEEELTTAEITTHSQVTDLPPGWVWTTVDEISTKVVDGTHHTPTYSNSGIAFISVKDIRDGSIFFDDCKYISEEEHKRLIQRCHPEQDDVLITKSGTIGRVAVVKTTIPFSLFVSVALIKPRKELIYSDFFRLALEFYIAGINIQQDVKGGLIKNLHLEDLRIVPIMLPPLTEQKRILAEIEKEFTRLDAGVASLKRAKANLKRYKAAVLKAACEGKLVQQDPSDEPASELLKRILAERRTKWADDLRAKGKDPSKLKYEEPTPPNTEGLPELPPGWCWTSLDLLSYFVTSGSRGWAKYYADSGNLFVRVGNFNRLETIIDLTNVVFVSPPSGAEGDRTRLRINDILVTITADVGMVGVVDERLFTWGDAFINQHVGLVRPVIASTTPFVALALSSEPIQIQIRNRQYGATKTGLGLDDLKALVIPLPPNSEQNRIVAEVERWLSVVQELEAVVAANLKRAERLRQSILKQAFEGKLVPQDPSDEPASELLKRIRQERQQREKPAREKPSRAGTAGKTKPDAGQMQMPL